MSIGTAENECVVRDALKAACKQRGSQKAFALDQGISEVVLSDMLRGKRTITPRIAKMVGYERVTVFRQLTNDREEKDV